MWRWHSPQKEEIAATYTAAPAVLDAIENHIGKHHAERGAMLGGSRERSEITAVHVDLSARTAGAEYSPDVETLNRVLNEWNEAEIEFLGFVHSHPRGVRRPSGADEQYAERILGVISGLETMLMPIVMTEPDTGAYELLGYVARKDEDGQVTVSRAHITVDVALTAKSRVGGEETSRRKKPWGGTTASPVVSDVALDELRVRVRNAYDGDRLAHTRVVVMGVGGARGLLESLARCFVGEFVLIDHDVSSASNVGTQAAFVDDIGVTKVSALADRIRAINPYAKVSSYACRAQDMDARQWERILTPDNGARFVTLLSMTDDFYTQAFGNRLALQFGVPSVAAGMYGQGEGCEVTFTHPDVTPACHRCALSSRYEAYLKQGYTNAVTSHGTPYPAIDVFNGLIGCIALAVMHHGSDHPRWGNLLRRIGNRNLVLAKLWPDFSLPSIDAALRGADAEQLFGPVTVWRAQPGDHPKNDPSWAQCPDCGGHGDLRQAKGSFVADLYRMRGELPESLRDTPSCLVTES